MDKHCTQAFLQGHMRVAYIYQLLLKGWTFKSYCCYLFVVPIKPVDIICEYTLYHARILHLITSERGACICIRQCVLLRVTVYVCQCNACVIAGSPSRGGDFTVYVFDINQPSLPTPFF